MLRRLEEILTHHAPAVIALDFPLALGGVRGWRKADLATTRAFSRFGCPVHSPTPDRPGEWGDQIVEIMQRKGYHLGLFPEERNGIFVEVYPHTVLLDIFRLTRRLPYKAGRSAQYWPELCRDARTARLLDTYQAIWRRLETHWKLPQFPHPGENPLLRDLKTLEDLTDALVCLEAARKIQNREYLPFGDSEAAIWNPDPRKLHPSEA